MFIMQDPSPAVDPAVVNTAIAAAAAAGGGVARGRRDWVDPVTGKFSAWRMFSGLAACLMLGALSYEIGHKLGLDPMGVNLAASIFGYLGPALVIDLLTKLAISRFGGSNAPKPKPE